MESPSNDIIELDNGISQSGGARIAQCGARPQWAGAGTEGDSSMPRGDAAPGAEGSRRGDGGAGRQEKWRRFQEILQRLSPRQKAVEQVELADGNGACLGSLGANPTSW